MKTLNSTAISVLDLARVHEGQSLGAVFKKSEEMAQLAERLGYTRYWLAEHHNLPGIASAATSVLIGHIAGKTSKIRVGSGGIMLPNHAPLVIAEQFGTLATLYPGRIDLGLGRAPGSDGATMRALRRDHTGRELEFSDLIEELQFYFAPAQPGQRVRAIPGEGIHVPLYILGSSLYSAQLAARLGLPYAFAGHFAPQMMIEAFHIYRSTFQPSAALEKPYVMAGIPVVAADTDEKAKYLATSLQQTFLGMVRGMRKIGVPPVPDIELLWSPQEKAAVQSMLGLLVMGGPQKVRHELDAFIASTQVDELIISTDTYDDADRFRSLEIIAQSKALGA